MKEEILTAKEWLEKEEIYNSYIDHSKQGEEIGLIRFSEIMEKYANYKNKVLEDRIKEFRQILKNQVYSFSNVYDDVEISFLNEYDKHFNINKQ